MVDRSQSTVSRNQDIISDDDSIAGIEDTSRINITTFSDDNISDSARRLNLYKAIHMASGSNDNFGSLF